MLPTMCAQPVPGNPGRPRNRITPIQYVGLGVLTLLFLNQRGLLRLSGGGRAVGGLERRLPFLVGLVLAITVHEFSHGFVATLFGDDLPRRVGRLTLNPLKHLDPLGTLLILIGPIGWGRPMPINPAGMRNPNLGWALSSLAGPVSNVLAASVVVILLALPGLSIDRSVMPYLQAFIGVNVALAVFNLLPVPPLVGYDASGENGRRAQQVKAIDRRVSLRDALGEADLVIIATPVGAMKNLLEEMAPLLRVGTVVMD